MSTVLEPEGTLPARRAIGRAVKFLRRREQLTQRQLADRLGVTINAVSELERGIRNVGIDSLLRINAALDLEPGEALEVAAEYIRLDALDGGADTLQYRQPALDLRFRAPPPPVPHANSPPG